MYTAKGITNSALHSPSIHCRYCHQAQLFPYLISGLYDSNDQICSLVFEILEELGLAHEETYESKFRERKQLGFNEEWTLNGKIKDA